MEKITKLTTDQALKLMSRAIGQDAKNIRIRLENGTAEAFALLGCNFVTCFEQELEHKVFVIMCAEGKNLVDACNVLKQLAKNCGCTKARIFTKRKGMTRLMKNFNLEQQETIYEGKL